MLSLFSCCKTRAKITKITKITKKSLDEVLADLDDTEYLKNYIMNYDSIPYFIPEIKYARVTDVRQDYIIVVAARLPFKNSLVYRFPIKLKGLESDKEDNRIESSMMGMYFPSEHSNKDYKAMVVLMPLICNNIVELRNVKNYFGTFTADVYFNGIHINCYLKNKGLALSTLQI